MSLYPYIPMGYNLLGFVVSDHILFIVTLLDGLPLDKCLETVRVHENINNLWKYTLTLPTMFSSFYCSVLSVPILKKYVFPFSKTNEYTYYIYCTIDNALLFIAVLYFGNTWVHPRLFGGVRVGHLIRFLCCVSVFFVLFVIILCFVCPVSLHCPFLILFS